MVVSVASRRFEEESTLLNALSQSVPAMVWSYVGVYQHSRHTIKAMILLCVWPFPTSSMWTDPSFILITVARSAAIQLGLHKPELINDFSRIQEQTIERNIREAAMIWAACYIAGQWLVS